MEKIIPEGFRVVRSKSIDLQERDIITISNWDDFLFFGDQVIFELKNTYYIIKETVAFIYKQK